MQERGVTVGESRGFVYRDSMFCDNHRKSKCYPIIVYWLAG